MKLRFAKRPPGPKALSSSACHCFLAQPRTRDSSLGNALGGKSSILCNNRALLSWILNLSPSLWKDPLIYLLVEKKNHSVSGILVKREALALGALVSGTRLCQFPVGDLGQSANLFLCLFSPLYKKESDIDFSGLQRGPIRWHE